MVPPPPSPFRTADDSDVLDSVAMFWTLHSPDCAHNLTFFLKVTRWKETESETSGRLAQASVVTLVDILFRISLNNGQGNSYNDSIASFDFQLIWRNTDQITVMTNIKT